jgi:hypothetical protein
MEVDLPAPVEPAGNNEEAVIVPPKLIYRFNIRLKKVGGRKSDYTVVDFLELMRARWREDGVEEGLETSNPEIDDGGDDVGAFMDDAFDDDMILDEGDQAGKVGGGGDALLSVIESLTLRYGGGQAGLSNDVVDELEALYDSDFIDDIDINQERVIRAKVDKVRYSNYFYSTLYATACCTMDNGQKTIALVLIRSVMSLLKDLKYPPLPSPNLMAALHKVLMIF